MHLLPRMSHKQDSCCICLLQWCNEHDAWAIQGHHARLWGEAWRLPGRLPERLPIFSKGSTKAFFIFCPNFFRPLRFFFGSCPGTMEAGASLMSASELAPRS